jgi:hypothetical protein
LPFVRHADASAPAPVVNEVAGNGGGNVRQRVNPDGGLGDPALAARLGELRAEHRFHLAAVLVAETARHEAEQQAIPVHLTTVALAKVAAPPPGRGFNRERAIFTSAPRRSVSAASARCPVRVSR